MMVIFLQALLQIDEAANFRQLRFQINRCSVISAVCGGKFIEIGRHLANALTGL